MGKCMDSLILRWIRCVVFLAVSGGFCLTARAADSTWTASSSGNWSTGSNWSTLSAPGLTTSTTNTDTATFSGTLDSNPTITIDQADQNIGSIILTGSANGADTIGTTGGNALLLSSGGSITMSGADSTINAPLILEPANATSNGTYTFTGGSFGGAISGGITTGTITLNLVLQKRYISAATSPMAARQVSPW